MVCAAAQLLVSHLVTNAFFSLSFKVAIRNAHNDLIVSKSSPHAAMATLTNVWL